MYSSDLFQFPPPQNVCDLPAKRGERIAELRALLKKRNLSVTPDDDRQMLLLLRAGNCDPEKAAEVTKVFLDYKRSMLGSECSSANYEFSFSMSKFGVRLFQTSYPATSKI